jgi:hypothetical protein
MTNIPKVKDSVEIKLSTHTFLFRRLTWKDTAQLNVLITKHKMQERLAIPALSMVSVSGRPVSVDEAFKLLTSIPRPILDTIHKLYRGGLDPHRMFEVPPLYTAPDATTYSKRLAEEEEGGDQVVDELEEFLTQKFGKKEAQEEMEMGRRIVAGTGYAGAISKETEYLESTQRELNEGDVW